MLSCRRRAALEESAYAACFPYSIFLAEPALSAGFAAMACILGHRRWHPGAYRSPDHWLKVFRTYYGPLVKAFASLGSERQNNLAQEIIALLKAHHQGGAGLVVPSKYIEVVIIRR